MKMKKLVSGILVLCMLFGMVAVFAACGDTNTDTNTNDNTTNTGDTTDTNDTNNATDGEKDELIKDLQVAYNNSTDYPHYKTLTWAAEELEKQTNGRYTMTIFPDGQLGDQKASLELTQSGAVDMCVVNATIMESFNSDYAILSTPYLFSGDDHIRAVYTSDVLDDLYNSTADQGFVVAAPLATGSRNIFCNKEVRSPDDLSGMKFRVMQSDTMVTMLELMGGTGVPMSASEQYSAMQQGVVDGAETNPVDYVTKKYYEVFPIFSYTEHMYDTNFIAVSTNTLNAMSDEDRAIFEEVMAGAAEMEFEYWDEAVQAALETAKDLDITWVEDVDKEAFSSKFVDFQQEIANRSEGTKAIYAAIQELDPAAA